MKYKVEKNYNGNYQVNVIGGKAVVSAYKDVADRVAQALELYDIVASVFAPAAAEKPDLSKFNTFIVDSSFVNKVGYNLTTKQMVVYLQPDKTKPERATVYDNVPYDTFTAVLVPKDGSVGKAYNRFIKGSYVATYQE